MTHDDDIPPGDAALLGAIEKLRRLNGPRPGVTAELMHHGTWLELEARVEGGRVVHRSGWDMTDFSEKRLEHFSEWLEREVRRIERRHLRIVDG